VALADLDILVAFVFGSVARDETPASSDVDIMIVGECSLKDITSALAAVPGQLGREVKPVVLSLEEFRTRISWPLWIGFSTTQHPAKYPRTGNSGLPTTLP
jgi:predicted nucleotidyltransferase